MPFQLVIIQGRSATKAVRLGGGSTIATMGRQPGCTVRINSSLVSRRHCELFEKKGLLLVKDLNSSNGTYVNGKKVAEQQVLEAGDELAVGPIRFRVEAVAAGAAATTGDVPGSAAVAPMSGTGAGTEGGAAKDAEEFEITFDDAPVEDEETQMAAPGSQPAAVVEEISTVAAKPAPAPAPKSQEDPNDAPIPVTEVMGDDAVADFLMGIELDEEDKK